MKGYTGSFRGIPIAVEKHADGSVTICKELVADIVNDTSIPEWIRGLLK